MPTHVEVLQKARDEMVKTRRDMADALSKPYDPGKTPRMRTTFIEIQSLIEQIDKAIADEHNLVVPAPVKGFSAKDQGYTTDVPDDGYKGTGYS